MSLLVLLARSSRALLVWAMLTSVLSGLGGALVVALINQALGGTAAELPSLGLAFAGACVGVLVLRWLSQRAFLELSQRTLAELRLHVSGHLAEAPYRRIENQGQGALLAVLTEDVSTISEFFVALPRLVMQGAVILGCFAYLAYLSWIAFGLSVSLVVLGSVSHLLRVRRANKHLALARDGEDELYDQFCALLGGAKELKLNAARRAAFLSDLLAASVERVRGHRRRGLLVYVAAGSFGAFLFFVVIGAVVFGLGSLLPVEAGVRSGYTLVFLYMMHPMEALLEAFPALGRTGIAVERIRAVGTGAPRVAPDAEDAPTRIESISLEGVTHTYRRDNEDGVFQLGPISLELRPGELVMLVGGNGSGKTTLAKLLVGLYEPEAGTVRLDGASVDAAGRERYRQLFSAVFTEFHLFESLIGIDPERLDERARELLVALDLAHKVQIEGGTLSTTALSRGQQKRLALLVTLLEDRPVYVFDEWAADQDPAYKDVFYHQLLPMLRTRGKAVFVITHDDRYFHLADRCLKLESGRLLGRDPALSPEAGPRTALAGAAR
jgi:putative ATP-binding cassette transporter